MQYMSAGDRFRRYLVDSFPAPAQATAKGYRATLATETIRQQNCPSLGYSAEARSTGFRALSVYFFSPESPTLARLPKRRIQY